MLASSKSKFSILFLAILAIVVACGAPNDEVPVQIVPRSPLGQAVEQCRSEIPSSKKSAVSGETSICEVVGQNEATGKNVYQFVQYPVNYSITNGAGRFNIGLKVGVDLPKELLKNQEIQREISYVLRNVCLLKFRSVWGRSAAQLNTNLDVAMRRADLARKDSERLERLAPDQILPLEFASVEEGHSKDFPALVMGPWPEAGVLYPKGRKAESDKCRQQVRGVSANEQKKRFKECMVQEMSGVHDRFCVGFATRLMQWLGVDGDFEMENKCLSPVEKRTAEMMRDERRDSLVVTARKTQDKPKEFWSRARLTSDDMMSILGPACQSVERLRVQVQKMQKSE